MNGAAVAGAGLVAVLAVLAGLWLRWHREAPKSCSGLFAVAGLAVGDVLGRLIAAATAKLPSSPAGLWLSLLVAGLLIAATVELVVKGMWPRRARPRHWHPWLALALPTIAIGLSAPLIGPLMSGLAAGVGGLGTAVITTTTAGHHTTAGGQVRTDTTTHTAPTSPERGRSQGRGE